MFSKLEVYLNYISIQSILLKILGNRKNKRKNRPQQGPQKRFIIIDKQDAIRHEILGTSPEGTVHSLENKI